MTKRRLSREVYYNERYDDRPAATEIIYDDNVRLSCYGVHLDRLSSQKNSHGSGVYALFKKGGIVE